MLVKQLRPKILNSPTLTSRLKDLCYPLQRLHGGLRVEFTATFFLHLRRKTSASWQPSWLLIIEEEEKERGIHCERSGFLLRKGGVRLGRVDWDREKIGVATQIRSRNHLIVPLRGRNKSYYQNMGSEFRYGFGKVLGTQNFLTRGSASSHCVLRLNPIKDIFHIVILTLTHTSIHLSIQHETNHPKTLTCIYHGIISS